MTSAGWFGRILDEADARQLPALVAEWLDERDARRWIARALRLDLALLTARPELTVPCLVRRFAWLDTPAIERRFYAERPGAEPALVEAATLVAAWRDRRKPRPPWWRALRPPVLPLDAGAVEEYRTSARGELVLDDDRAGIAGAIAWDRGTGRQVAAAPAPEVPPRTWEVAHGAADRWGTLTLVGAGREVTLEHDGNEIVRGVRPLAGGLVLVTGDDLDLDDFFAVIDPDGPRIAWRGTGLVTAAAVHGDALALVIDERFELRGLRAGELRARWYCPPASALALSASGAVATRHGSVIRVWDPALARAWGVFAPLSTNAFIGAELSADGSRLQTGRLLCDARTGEPIAALALNGPHGWIEGGPPRQCQRLVNGAVVETLPWGLTIWDAKTGAALLEDRARSAQATDVVAYDPTGRAHAIYRDRAHRLEIYGLHGGELLFERTWTLARPRLGFTTDGTRLLVEDLETAERWIVTLAAPNVVLTTDALPWEPAPRNVDVVDGVLELGGAAIPCDVARVTLSPSGAQAIAPHAHYTLAG